jgi:hypothetical protein
MAKRTPTSRRRVRAPGSSPLQRVHWRATSRPLRPSIRPMGRPKLLPRVAIVGAAAPYSESQKSGGGRRAGGPRRCSFSPLERIAELLHGHHYDCSHHSNSEPLLSFAAFAFSAEADGLAAWALPPPPSCLPIMTAFRLFLWPSQKNHKSCTKQPENVPTEVHES